MKYQAAEALIMIVVSVGLLFLMPPLAAMLGELPAVWHTNRWSRPVVTAVMMLTGAFLLAFLGGIIALTFSGTMMR